MRDMLTLEVPADLERFIAAQQEPRSLPTAVNGILADWLSSHGYLPVEQLPESEN